MYFSVRISVHTLDLKKPKCTISTNNNTDTTKSIVILKNNNRQYP